MKLRLLQVLIGFPSLLPRYFCRRLLSATRIVVFAESEDAKVLGVDALEGLRLGVDPVTKQLRKVEALLALRLSCSAAPRGSGGDVGALGEARFSGAH
ncbi:MAG: hypothetical protein QXH81_10110 [Thermofilaceae archaeon]